MSFFSKLFSGGKEKAAAATLGGLRTDMHSHLLPGLDDGAETLEKSLELVETMLGMGYTKLIMTPHVMGDFYKNSPEDIHAKLELLQNAVTGKGWPVELGCAAEYYLDEWFIEKLEANTPLMTFGKEKYLLFETSYINESSYLKSAVFTMLSAGYKPVLAHPERYTYLYGKFDDLTTLHDMGVLFQINVNSLSGYYSEGARHVAEKLIDNKMVEMAGSDCHSMKHLHFLKKAEATKYFHKLMALPLLNQSL